MYLLWRSISSILFLIFKLGYSSYYHWNVRAFYAFYVVLRNICQNQALRCFLCFLMEILYSFNSYIRTMTYVKFNLCIYYEVNMEAYFFSTNGCQILPALFVEEMICSVLNCLGTFVENHWHLIAKRIWPLWSIFLTTLCYSVLLFLFYIIYLAENSLRTQLS